MHINLMLSPAKRKRLLWEVTYCKECDGAPCICDADCIRCDQTPCQCAELIRSGDMDGHLADWYRVERNARRARTKVRKSA